MSPAAHIDMMTAKCTINPTKDWNNFAENESETSEIHNTSNYPSAHIGCDAHVIARWGIKRDFSKECAHICGYGKNI